MTLYPSPEFLKCIDVNKEKNDKFITYKYSCKLDFTRI